MNIWTAPCCLAAFLFSFLAFAQEKKDLVLKPNEFPPANTAQYIAGDLVLVDPINRRGGLRLDGDFNDDRYHNAPPHRFAMLPYGSVWYHGAPAELRDVPIGTHLHGYFYLPPEGEKAIPPYEGPGKQYVPRHNHAFSLEDDFSFYSRRGQAWKIVSLKKGEGLKPGELKVVSTGEKTAEGLSGEKTFEIDSSTRIWKGRQQVELEDLAADQAVQVNLTWAPEWKNGRFHCADVWIDRESRELATRRQRQIHLRYQHHHWLAGWVDHVTHEGGGKGTVTITLFAGMDSSLYDEVKAKRAHGLAVAAAEKTLRTWWQDHDHKYGRVVELKENKNPPPGSSGIQVRVQFNELLEGYRPGRIVRLRCNDWPNVKLPPEERVKSLEDQSD